MAPSYRFDAVSRTTRSRLLLLALAATTSLCAIDRAAADCVLTSGPGTAGDPQSGARVTCQATGGVEDASVRAEIGSSDVQVTIQSGATFTSIAPYVAIYNDSRITNAAILTAAPIDNSPIFLVSGSNNTVINTGTLINDTGTGILLDGGSANTIRNMDSSGPIIPPIMAYGLEAPRTPQSSTTARSRAGLLSPVASESSSAMGRVNQAWSSTGD